MASRGESIISGSWADCEADAECAPQAMEASWMICGDGDLFWHETGCGEEAVHSGTLLDDPLQRDCEEPAILGNCPEEQEVGDRDGEAEDMDEGRSADLDNEAYWLTSWMAAYEDASLAADLFVSNYNLHTTPSWPVYPIMEEPVDEAALAAEFDDNETATQPIVFGSVDESAAVDTTRPRAMTSPIQLGEHIVFGNFAAEGNMPGDHGDASTPTAITGLTADSDAFGAQPEAPEADPAPVENWSCLGDTSLMKCEVYSQQRQAMQIMLQAGRAASFMRDMQEQRLAMAETIGLYSHSSENWLVECSLGALKALGRWVSKN